MESHYSALAYTPQINTYTPNRRLNCFADHKGRQKRNAKYKSE